LPSQDTEGLDGGNRGTEEIETWLDSMCTSLERTIDVQYEQLTSKVERRFKAAEKRVARIAEAAGVRDSVSAGDDDMDRRRLKARRDAIASAHMQTRATCSPDGCLPLALNKQF
jgi:hypothetical protein